MILVEKSEMGAGPRVWLEISRTCLRTNVRRIKAFVAPLEVMAVIKADAYGLGAQAVAEILVDSGIACLGVAEVGTAVKLKALGLPVHILGALLPEEVPLVVYEQLIAPITDWGIAERLSAEAQSQGRIALGQFVIDTGMGRLGIQLRDALDLIRRVNELPGIDLVGMYSHFPSAYEDHIFSWQQVKQFRELIEGCRECGIVFKHLHIANSDGVHNVPAALSSPFTMVRTGINLYGAYDNDGSRCFELESVIKLKSRLVAVRDLPAGASIGYGRTLVLDEAKRIGTVAIGYADGLPVAIAGRGYLSVGGHDCLVVGRVSMDFTTVDLSEVPGAMVGDEVLCLDGARGIDEWARLKGSIPYEVICSFGPRVRRCYV